MTLADARIKEVIAAAPRQAAGGPNVHVAELRNVSLSFDDKLVLDQVSLAVDPQERLVIIGQSGAGKTTILRLILGILTPTAGSVFFQDHIFRSWRGTILKWHAPASVWFIRTRRCSARSRSARTLPCPCRSTTKSEAEINRLAEEKLEWVEMAGTDDLMPYELRGGMRKRVGLARALMMEPELILFDEPTQGLDPVVSAVIDKLIVELTERAKVTSIIVTHLMDSAFRVATRMAMLYRGRIIEQGTPAEMRASKNPIVVQFLSGSTEGPILERSRYHILSPAV